MRFLANENVPLDAVSALREIGHDVIWVRVDAHGSPDEDILSRAVAEKRVLITFDKDFGNLAFRFASARTERHYSFPNTRKLFIIYRKDCSCIN